MKKLKKGLKYEKIVFYSQGQGTNEIVEALRGASKTGGKGDCNPEFLGNFLVQAFRGNIKNFGFGYAKGLTGTRFLDRKILLLKTSEGNPDGDFMENYMRFQEQKLILEYLKSVKN